MVGRVSASLVSIFTIVFLAGFATAGPLHDAAKSGSLAKVRERLARGDDPNIRVQQPNEAMDQTTPLHWAALFGQTAIAELLLSHGADVDPRAAGDVTPLYLAAIRDRVETARLLIKFGARVNAIDKHGISPLHRAAIKGHIDMVELLIANHADENASDEDGLTPLHLAANQGHHDVAMALVEAGADVNSSNSNGSTPLHTAAARGKKDLVALLLRSGANTNAIDNAGITPLFEAKKDNDRFLVDLLIANGAINYSPMEALEIKYQTSLDEYDRGDALERFESAIFEQILTSGPKARFVVKTIQPDENYKWIIRFTIRPSKISVPTGETDQFIVTTQTATDSVSIGGIHKFGNKSIVRFAGTVPFPLESPGYEKSPFRESWGGRAPREMVAKYKVTNAIIVNAIAKPNYLVFEGLEEDPLSFGFFKGLGFVYLHGRGSVTFPDGRRIELPASSSIAAPDERAKGDIAAAQRKLTELGYDPGPIDGLWGRKTESAVGLFQRDHDIQQTGALNSATKKALGL